MSWRTGPANWRAPKTYAELDAAPAGRNLGTWRASEARSRQTEADKRPRQDARRWRRGGEAPADQDLRAGRRTGGEPGADGANALPEEIAQLRLEVASLEAEQSASEQALRELGRCAGTSPETGPRKRRAHWVPGENESLTARRRSGGGVRKIRGPLSPKTEAVARLSEEKIALEAERTAKNRAGQEMNENLLNLERSAAKLDQKRATSAMEEKQILDRLWEHYELSHSDAQEVRVELESVPKATRRIGELKRDITALGTPNIGAIDEFQRVNTRYTYLTDQRNDVEKAKGRSSGYHREITSQMTEIFAQQFQLLSESFQTTFEELFGGGRHLPGRRRGPADHLVGPGRRGHHQAA